MASAAVTPPPLVPAAAPTTTTNFVFINDSNPTDSKSKEKRKLVRAQAARGAHSLNVSTVNGISQPRQETQQTKNQAAKRSRKERESATIQLDLSALDHLPPQSFDPFATRSEPIVVTVRDKASGSVTPALTRESTETEIVSPSTDTVSNENRSSSGQASPPSSTSSTSVVLYQPGVPKSQSSTRVVVPPNHGGPISQSGTNLARRNPGARMNQPRPSVVFKNPGVGWSAPFDYPPELNKPYMRAVSDHYIQNMAVAIPELDVDIPYSLRNRWYPMALRSRPNLYIIILTAATHFVIINDMATNPTIKVILLELREKAFQALQARIKATPAGQPIADDIIAACCKLGSYEAMFGEEASFHQHMRQLQRLVDKRGGLHTLGMEGLLRRMILFVDINAAFLRKTQPYFKTLAPLAGHVAMEPDPTGFLCGIK